MVHSRSSMFSRTNPRRPGNWLCGRVRRRRPSKTAASSGSLWTPAPAASSTPPSVITFAKSPVLSPTLNCCTTASAPATAAEPATGHQHDRHLVDPCPNSVWRIIRTFSTNRLVSGGAIELPSRRGALMREFHVGPNALQSAQEGTMELAAGRTRLIPE